MDIESRCRSFFNLDWFLRCDWGNGRVISPILDLIFDKVPKQEQEEEEEEEEEEGGNGKKLVGIFRARLLTY